MRARIKDILEDSNKIIIVTITIKIIVVILLFFAFAGQPSGYYIFLRWMLFIIFLMLAFLDQQRDKKISLYFWIAFATIFNPIIPIYFHNVDIWLQIDSFVWFTILVTLYTNDITCYNFELEIAEHIDRVVRKSNVLVLRKLLGYAQYYYNEASQKNEEKNKRKFFRISEQLFNILIGYDQYNPDYYIQRGIVKSSLYHISVSSSDFQHANKLNNQIRIPAIDDINDLTFENFKKKLYL